MGGGFGIIIIFKTNRARPTKKNKKLNSLKLGLIHISRLSFPL